MKPAPAPSPVDKLVYVILIDARKKGASDIWLEADQDGLRVLHEIGGARTEVMRPPPLLRDAVVSRLKEMAGFGPPREESPGQNHYLSLAVGGEKHYHYCVSACPTPGGERVRVTVLNGPPPGFAGFP
jgi:type IV pilus assembly protein PilB